MASWELIPSIKSEMAMGMKISAEALSQIPKKFHIMFSSPNISVIIIENIKNEFGSYDGWI